jgi:hypothetical protein
MLRKLEAVVASVLACAAFAAGAQQGLRIVPGISAAGVRAQGDTVSVEWVLPEGSTVAAMPPECDIYYAAAPAGGDLSKYTKLASPLGAPNELKPFGAGQKRVTRFVPAGQGGRMKPGVYCLIAASKDGALYSDYLTLMIASAEPPAILSPKADVMKGELVKKLSDPAPLFTWKAVAGVPYYHIVLSDVPFVDAGGNPNAGVNIIWQAITPNTRIAYGAPDPSNTITAPSPPLSPGTTYSWMVLNNYGNRPAFTSWDVISVMDGVAGRIEIEGGGLAAPRALSPARGDTVADARLTFSWAGLDTNANSYLLNLFREGAAADFGMEGMGKFSMSMLAWERVVPRGNRGADQTLSVTLDANGTLSGGAYRWRVYALDKQGKAYTSAAGDNFSTATFTYKRGDEGFINVTATERMGGVDTLPVGYVDMKSEVLSGATMAPLLFNTNGGGGTGARRFAAGTYRVTAVKEGYFNYTATVTVSAKDTVNLRMRMSRPEAALYGRVLMADSSAVSGARVTAVSEWGDTAATATDGNGNFALACRAADWTVTAEKSGFSGGAPRKATLRIGDNDFGSVVLAKNPFALSGTVRNSLGAPLVGARVRVLRDGVPVDELASTPQSGAYAFYLNSGVYTVTAEKPGFAMFSRSVAVTGTMAQDIALREGAVVVSGAITGKSWVARVGGYVYAPVASARVSFAEDGVARPDTFTVASDPVFGRFSVSLPKDRNYKVTVSAAGFAPSGAARGFTTEAAGDELSKEYSDTLYALAAIKGRVLNVGGDAQIDVTVSDGEGRVVASVKSAGGVYEARNIPDGDFRLGAGGAGYFARDGYAVAVSGGSLNPNKEYYDFTMEPGNKSIVFKADGYTGGGTVKIISPFNRTLPLGETLGGVGFGSYAAEAVPNDSNRLELSYHAFSIPEGRADVWEEALRFPFTHIPGDTAELSGGKVKIFWPKYSGNLYSPIDRITLCYSSEGSARFDSAEVKNVGGELPFDVAPARDGCNLYYYFRVYLSNGDIYGSGKQLYRSYVKPNDRAISRVAVEPGAAGGDTLAVPSSYPAAFAFRAFYSGRYRPIDGNAGTVSWRVWDAAAPTDTLGRGTGMTYAFTTPDGRRDLFLRAELEPQNGYGGQDGVPLTVEFPVRVTGELIGSMEVVSEGDAGAISNKESVGFRVYAVDAGNNPVTVSPKGWRVFPGGAGTVSADGQFTPSPGFVGVADITAVFDGGREIKYAGPGAAVPGQGVYYAFKNAAGGDTANTFKNMKVVFGPGTLREGMGTNLEVAVPALDNHVHRGTEEYRMADSLAFELTYSDARAVGGDVLLAFDIPPELRGAAKGGDAEFRVARWFPDSLRWVPIGGDRTRIEGNAVIARLSPPDEAANEPGLSKTKAGKVAGRLWRNSAKKTAAATATAAALPREAAFAASARYALVTKTSNTTLAVSVSPHPFSPYIVPVREYPVDAKAGTCIKVNVQAPEPYVKSVKVRIYNATGKMVWGIEKLNAETGENRFWWNGRTGGRGGGRSSVNEEVWSADYYERNAGRPLCRNGRYYVMVIITDMEENQRRAMKPLVLMK